MNEFKYVLNRFKELTCKNILGFEDYVLILNNIEYNFVIKPNLYSIAWGQHRIPNNNFIKNNDDFLKCEIAQELLKELDYDNYLLNEKLKEELLINNTNKKVVKI